MHTVNLILYILAAICFVLAALGVGTSRVSIGWVGLFFWVLVPLIGAVD